MTQWNFQSAVVPVTGGASGIGLAISKALRAAGAIPLILDFDRDRLAAAVLEVFPEFDAETAGRHGYVLDVADAAAVDDCFTRILRDHGPIAHLVANAGIGAAGSILDITDKDWRRVIDVNLDGVMHVCRAGARQLAPQQRGSIVAVASIAGLSAKRGRVAYTASKAGVINLTRAMALDLGEHGIRVNAVAPGIVETAMQQMNDESYNRQRASRTALGRLGRAEEIADAVLFLLSEQSSYITGQVLVVDGGLTANYA